jgi:hypothetical protein
MSILAPAPYDACADVATARTGTYGDQRALDDLMHKEQERLCTPYEVPALEDLYTT